MSHKRTIVGLDIGSYSVKAVWAEAKGSHVSFTRTESIRLSLDSSETASIIAPWLKQINISGYSCVIGAPGHLSMFQPFTMPPEDHRTVEQAAAMEVVKFNEMASETMIYGSSPITINPGERRFLLAMARPAVLDQVISAARGLGIDIVDIIPSPVALFNAMEKRVPPHDRPNMYVNIGHVATDVAVGSGAGLLFARSFPMAGRAFTEALASESNLSSAKADELKTTDGALQVDKGRQAIVKALMPAAEAWLSEFQSCLSVYSNLFPDPKCRVGRIVLSGGGSELKGLPEFISEAMAPMNIEVTCAGEMKANRNPISGPAFAIAEGLAVTGVTQPPCRISVLPPDLRDAVEFRRQKPFWIAAGIAAALILGVSLACGYYDIYRMEKHLGKRNAAAQRMEQLRDNIETVRARNDQIFAMSKTVQQLLSTAPVFRDLMALVAKAKSEDDYITMICDSDFYFYSKDLVPVEAPVKFTMRDTRRAPKPSDPNSATSRIERVVIEGYTMMPNFSSIKELITKIQADPFVESADLLSDDKLVTSEPGAEGMHSDRRKRKFVIDVTLKAP